LKSSSSLAIAKLLVNARILLLVALALLAKGVFASNHSDYAAAWQGQWRWALSADAMPMSYTRDSGGELAITQCKENRCTYAIPATGDVSSVCSAEGSIQLLSNEKATAHPNDERGPNQHCTLTFVQTNGRIAIEDKGDECRDFCGHSGPDFGADYVRVKRNAKTR
jgi:hypothetical protein